MLSTRLNVAGVIAGGVLFIVVIMRRTNEKKKGGTQDSESGFMKSRFYQYARLDKGEDQHVESLWKRNRFNHTWFCCIFDNSNVNSG